MATYRAAADFDHFSFGIRLFIVREYPEGRREMASAIEWSEVKPGVFSDPTAVNFPEPEGRQLLQAIMDAAWRFGLRPSASPDHGELAATRQRAEDMKEIALRLLPAQR